MRTGLFFTEKRKLLGYLVHRLADKCRGTAELCGARGVVAQHLAELSGAGESGEQPVQVANEDGRGAAFGGLA